MAVKKSSFAIALLLGLLMIGMSFGQTLFGLDTIFTKPSAVTCGGPEGDPFDWFKVAVAAMGVSIAITAGTWVLGGVLGTQKYWDHVRGGLWALIEGAVILSILSASFLGLQEFGTNNIDTARTYATIIRNTMALDLTGVVLGSTVFSFFATASPQFRPFGDKIGIYLTFQVAPMFRPIFDLIGIMIQMLSISVLEWFAHDFMLCFIKTKMLTVLLPAGLFLRIFGLKAAGNALMGIAISLYFMYPYMLVMTGQIVTTHFQNELDELPDAGEHVWLGCNLDRPICCMPPGSEVPSSLDPKIEPYIPNGDPARAEADINYRVSQNKTLNGFVSVSLDGTAPLLSTGTACVYTTVIARTVRPIFDMWGSMDIMQKGIYTGTAVLGIPLLISIMKLMNLSWMAPLMIIPAAGITLYFIYEVVYFVFIINIVMAIFIIFITLTFAKEIAKVLGTEIDLSALEQLI